MFHAIAKQKATRIERKARLFLAKQEKSQTKYAYTYVKYAKLVIGLMLDMKQSATLSHSKTLNNAESRLDKVIKETI